MALTTIPNQVFRFESIEQSGLNNDTAGWDILCQSGDTLAVQFKNEPCGSNLLCDALGSELNLNPCEILRSFTHGDGWAWESDGAGCYNAVHTGSGGVGITTYDTSGLDFASTCDAPNFYKVTFDVVAVSGGGVTPFFDSYALGGTHIGGYHTTIGTYTDYIQANASPAVLGFYASGDITIANISVKQVAPCFIITENWTSSDGVFLDHIAGNTDEIVTSSAVYTDGEYYSVDLTIKNRTAGSISVQVSNATAQTISSNGTFKLYFTNGIGGDNLLHITPDVDFDGSIRFDGSFQHARLHEFWLSDVDNNDITDHYTVDTPSGGVTIYKDWITWTFTLSDILYPDINRNSCIYLNYYDACADTYGRSDNKIKYSETTFEKTKMVQAYCSTEAFGFEFLNSDFNLYQRLPFLQISPKYPTEGEEFTSSAGRKLKLSTKVEKTKIAWVDYVDETAHDCLAIQIASDVLYIDGVLHHCPTNDYEPEWIENQKYNLAQSKFEIQKRVPTLYNRNA